MLFLRFLVNGALHTPITKLLELNFSLNFLFIFLAPVVGSFTLRTGEFY